jgi:hypothetical protein
MRTDTCLPGGGLLPLRSGWEAMALQNIAYGLPTDGVAKMAQGVNNAIIAPGAPFLGQARH